jgi:hypothetical protein
MPVPERAARRDDTRGGFARAITKEDLALDPERVLMQGNERDNLAAAIVDAEEAMAAERIEERQSAASNAVGRERRAFWNLGATYEHPADVPRDVSVGPGAFSWPEPDIVPRTPAQDVFRSDASGAYAYAPSEQGIRGADASRSKRSAYAMHAMHATQATQAVDVLACPFCAFATQSGPQYAAHVRAHARRQPAPARLASDAHAHAQAQAQARAQARAQPPSDVWTDPAADEATHFATSFYTPGHALKLVSASRAASALAARRGKPTAGGYGRVAAGAMRTSRPLLGAERMFDQPRTGSAEEAAAQAEIEAKAGAARAEAALYYGSAAPHYNVPAAPAARQGAHNRWGVSKLPGTARTTHELMRRDAEAQGVDLDAGLPPPLPLPLQGPLGFRFPDRAQWHYDTPKFFPARDPADKLLYEAAAAVAPDVAADVADFAALRGFDPDRMIEPLDARFEMMRLIEQDATHTRDPYMVPRTGPSVVHPGRNARPPAWYRSPGT